MSELLSKLREERKWHHQDALLHGLKKGSMKQVCVCGRYQPCPTARALDVAIAAADEALRIRGECGCGEIEEDCLCRDCEGVMGALSRMEAAYDAA